MISKKEFYNFISSYQKFSNGLDRFEKAITGKEFTSILFDTDWGNAVGEMLDIFLYSHFTEDGVDIITWWLFEDVDKIIYEKVDPDLFNGETEVKYDVNTFDNLWNYIKKYEKDYFKNAN